MPDRTSNAQTSALAPWQGHSTNLVGASTAFLADVAFNESSRRLTISGVREMNGPLFEMLGQAESLVEAGEAFSTYMTAMFGIDAEQRERRAGRARFRSSFLRLIKGWGYDSNSPEGAVLKGWVESRFGIPPLFHKTPIRRIGSGAWTTYVEEKMSSRFHDNSIYAQLDLLYEFCQWAFRQFVAPECARLTLYRGVNGLEEHEIVERLDGRRLLLRLNNLFIHRRPRHCRMLRRYDPEGRGADREDRVLQRSPVAAPTQGRGRISGHRRRISRRGELSLGV